MTVDMREVLARRQSHCRQGIANFRGVSVTWSLSACSESRGHTHFRSANEIQRNMIAKHLRKH